MARDPVSAADSGDLESLAALVADGAVIDWSEPPPGLPQDELSVFACLKQVHDIGHFHRRAPDADAAPAVTTLAPGDSWGDLLVLEEIGRGSFGRVYRARDESLQRDVALKILDVRDPGDGAFVAALREGRLLAKLRHPNVVTVHGARQVGSSVGIWMELVQGESLADAIERGGPMALQTAASIVQRLCDGLAAVHDAGLLHRDIKARNVMLEPGGRVVLMDFGTGHDARGGVQADLAGTPLYMAPELFRGAPPSIQSDVYSAGVLFYFLLTGAHPVPGRTLDTVLAGHTQMAGAGGRPPLDGVPPQSRPVLARALDPDPAARFRSAADLGAALAGLQTRKLSYVSVLVSVAAIAVLGMALAGFWGIRSGGAAVPRVERLSVSNHVALTRSSDIDEYPSVSPDGQTVAFSAAADGGPMAGNWDIWTMGVNGSPPVNLTEAHTGADRFPVWSSDGRLAFWSDRDGGGCYVTTRDAAAPRRVAAAHPLHGTRPAWSPDGSRLACVLNHSRNPEIVVTDLKTGAAETVAVPGVQGRVFDPAWSPDGRSIAFVDAPAQSADRSTLRMLNLETHAIAALTDGSTNVWSPQWSSDSRTLYVAANFSGTMDLWALGLEPGDGTEPRRAVTTGAGILSFSLMPDGSRIFFAKGQRAANVWRVRPRGDGPAAWPEAEQMTEETALIETLDVDPAGDRLVISSDRSGSPQIWSASATNRREPWRLVVGGVGTQWAGRISAHGDLTFYGLAGSNRRIWVAPRGQPAVQVTSGGSGEDVFPAWNPAGDAVAFCSNRTGNWDVWIRRLGEPADVRVTDDPADDSFPDWSPDGDRLVFASTRGGDTALWLLDPGTRAVSRLTDGPAWLGRWSRSGDAVLFIGHGARINTLWSVDAATRKETMIADLRGRRGSLGRYAVAEAAGQVYFVWESTSSDVWTAQVTRSESLR